MTYIVPNTASPEGWGMFAGRVYGGTRAAPDGGPPLNGEEAEPMPMEISFDELLESINPLQHLPGVVTFYRDATGNVAPFAARILVATAIGVLSGIIGCAASRM